jgi:hypothetical protein
MPPMRAYISASWGIAFPPAAEKYYFQKISFAERSEAKEIPTNSYKRALRDNG